MNLIKELLALNESSTDVAKAVKYLKDLGDHQPVEESAITIQEAKDPAFALKQEAMKALREMGFTKKSESATTGVLRVWMLQKPSSEFPIVTEKDQKNMLTEFAKRMPKQKFKVSKPTYNTSGMNFYQIETSEFELSFQNDDREGQIYLVCTKQGKDGDRFRAGYDA